MQLTLRQAHKLVKKIEGVLSNQHYSNIDMLNVNISRWVLPTHLIATEQKFAKNVKSELTEIIQSNVDEHVEFQRKTIHAQLALLGLVSAIRTLIDETNNRVGINNLLSTRVLVIAELERAKMFADTKPRGLTSVDEVVNYLVSTNSDEISTIISVDVSDWLRKLSTQKVTELKLRLEHIDDQLATLNASNTIEIEMTDMVRDAMKRYDIVLLNS